YFLNLHSSSLKKCIYFLQDRVSANCIKRIKKECYPGWKAQHFPPLVASKLEPENCERAREQCRTYVRQYSEEKIRSLFVTLTDGDDWSQDVVRYAIEICRRNTVQRCC